MYKKKKIYLVIFFVFTVLMIFSCSTKNYTIKNDIKKKIKQGIEQGDKYLNNNQFDRALDAYKQTLKLVYLVDDLDNLLIINLKIVDVYIIVDDKEKVEKQLNYCKDLYKNYSSEPVSFYYYLTVGNYLSYKKQYLDAIKNYKKALEFTKDKKLLALVYNRIGKNYIKINNLEQAEEFILKSLKINKSKKFYDGLADNYYNLGKIYYTKKDYENALDYLNQALVCDKINENISGILQDLLFLADIFIELKDFEIPFCLAALPR